MSGKSDILTVRLAGGYARLLRQVAERQGVPPTQVIKRTVQNLVWEFREPVAYVNGTPVYVSPPFFSLEVSTVQCPRGQWGVYHWGEDKIVRCVEVDDESGTSNG